MNTKTRRIAVNVGSGFVPGMNAVAKGITLAAAELGWDVVGIRNGFAGLLDPDDYPDGGLLTVSPGSVRSLHNYNREYRTKLSSVLCSGARKDIKQQYRSGAAFSRAGAAEPSKFASRIMT